MIHVDVYPVGILSDIKRRRLKNGLRHIRRHITKREWRALRNTFNGYLAEHEGCAHDCGRGWTQRAALRRVDAICERATR